MDRHLRFLIIDDDELMTALFEKMCKTLDILLRKENKFEFLETEFKEVYLDFDLCFVDLYIEGKQSVTFFEKNKSLLEIKNCILITTDSNFPLFQNALKIGFHEIYQKPITVRTFDKLVKDFSSKIT